MKGFRNTLRMNPYLRWVLVISNWLFQGIPNSDRTEKAYKIIFSLLLSGIIFVFLNGYFQISLLRALASGIFIGHTINWLVNGNFSNIIIHRLFLATVDKRSIFDYLESLSERLKNTTSIIYATSHGSICNGNLKPSSDVDVALVRNKGFIHGLSALYFVVRERKIADWKGIPLEIYLMDSIDAAINRFKNEDNPVVLYDPHNIIDRYYKSKLSISQAKELNRV